MKVIGQVGKNRLLSVDCVKLFWCARYIGMLVLGEVCCMCGMMEGWCWYWGWYVNVKAWEQPPCLNDLMAGMVFPNSPAENPHSLIITPTQLPQTPYLTPGNTISNDEREYLDKHAGSEEAVKPPHPHCGVPTSNHQAS